MGIKETPTNIRLYYKLFRDSTTAKKDEAVSLLEDIKVKVKEEHKSIEENKILYLTKFKINLDDYEEYKSNTYINGKFLKVAKGAFMNRPNDYELVSDLYDLFNFTKTQKVQYDLEKDIAFYDKLLSLNFKQYSEVLRAYYTQVHKKLVLEGNGYVFGHDIGWICVNRCLIKTRKPMLDFAATKKREKELLAEGKRIYNKEEADWCLRHGIEYKAEDKRVYKNDEYCYEIPLIGCKLPDGSKLKLEISDYRHSSCRGLTNDTLIENCGRDINKICELPIDVKTKLTLCDKIDKMLYTKFIRNENQESHNAPKACRKNRQRL